MYIYVYIVHIYKIMSYLFIYTIYIHMQYDINIISSIVAQ